MTQAAETVQLKQETLQAYLEYIGRAEAEMEEALRAEATFLWSDGSAERASHVREGRTIAELRSGKRPVKVPDGLIHDWIAATYAPDTTVQKAISLIQSYDNHKNIYAPEVIDSRLVSRLENDFKIYLRILKKKIISVVLDTDHDVHYSSVDPMRWCCRSYTTRISEVEDAGKPEEMVRPPDAGYGFLWRLYSYWRFQERDGGVWMECRAISLTRDVPKGLGWVIEPIIKKLPKEALVFVLEATRRALASQPEAASAPS